MARNQKGEGPPEALDEIEQAFLKALETKPEFVTQKLREISLSLLPTLRK